MYRLYQVYRYILSSIYLHYIFIYSTLQSSLGIWWASGTRLFSENFLFVRFFAALIFTRNPNFCVLNLWIAYLWWSMVIFRGGGHNLFPLGPEKKSASPRFYWYMGVVEQWVPIARPPKYGSGQWAYPPV